MLPQPHSNQNQSSGSDNLEQAQCSREFGFASLKRKQRQETPYWAEHFSEPAEVDFQAEVQDDLKTIALLAAVRQLADQNGNSVAAQLDTWNQGRG